MGSKTKYVAFVLASLMLMLFLYVHILNYKPPENESLAWLLNRPIAHRGLHANNSAIPENSLKAFDAAANKEYIIELDIHLLADKNLAVFHDDNLQRICGINTEIKSLTAKELAKINLLGSEEKIPLLDEVFELVNGKVPILIEIKNQDGNNSLIQDILISKLKEYNGKVAVQSFNPFLLKKIIKEMPHIPRGQLSQSYLDVEMNPLKKYLLKNMLLNFASKPHFIAYNFLDMPNKMLEKERAKGIKVLCWTARTESEYEKIKPMCDNIIFENFTPLP